MLSLPLANFTVWLNHHLRDLMGVGFNQSPGLLPFVAIAILYAGFIMAGIKRGIAAMLTGVLGALILVSAVSHGLHGGEGFLGFLGFSSHAFYGLVAAGLLFVILQHALSDEGEVPGRFRSAVEMVAEFVRDQIVRPIMGLDGDAYLPVILTFFSFILLCNLLGLTPGSTTATGSYFVTGSLAAIAFLYYHGCGVAKNGIVPYIEGLVPVHAKMNQVGRFALAAAILIGLIMVSTDSTATLVLSLLIPVALFASANFSFVGAMELLLWYFMLGVELIGHIVKPVALTVRLWANMTGGHGVLYVAFGFAFMFHSYLIGTVVSIPASIMIMALELMVAVIQAYIFTLLLTVFLQGVVSPEH